MTHLGDLLLDASALFRYSGFDLRVFLASNLVLIRCYICY